MFLRHWLYIGYQGKLRTNIVLHLLLEETEWLWFALKLVCMQTVVLMQIEIASLHPKYLCEICPVLPYYCSLASQILSLPTDICKLRVWLVRL